MEEQVTMTPEERAEYEEFRAQKAREREEAARKAQREEYARLVDDEVAAAVDQLKELSEQMTTIKKTIFDNFDTIIRMKREVMSLCKPDGQYTHTFTSSDSRCRITLGNRMVDDYRDTVEDGIAMVKDYITSLAKDEDSAQLVGLIMSLLERNKSGALQPSRVIRLRQLADKRQDPRLLEGVKIIEDSYQPYASSTFVQAEIKGATGWMTIPLNISAV
ncbi:DUF3164 family protein [Porphyromonas endodontalis]|uniref:DUF3164 family protein n=1 Tax=Porphyromonas endodontalis (strain ATCC 35406 / DSM 24491 / JCM 8526 / CCUG 16442 / BCRC 14492 / NCTC 13058 / HG 370) TaxID=553175 RepID=C3JB89_POREA|nr:DUF3164 family protein [Porphyromonas endodontalis]EEN82543.1 hypothetical protein POREN0001_1532 [Porphyromonas endodontalis ATCC 35406]UBH64713.1 DUF3164 family protein [Porphyromonas endodontalis]SUB76813.1 Protein of uncharacterised function (DUF3164) [Porphyromonas endodontalis]